MKSKPRPSVSDVVRCLSSALLAAALMLLAGAPCAKAQLGAFDSFDPNVLGSFVQSVATQPDGRVILVGNFTTVGGTERNNIARVETNGALDHSFNPNANSNVLCAAVQADGKILIGGAFTTLQPNGAASSTPRNRLARLHADGTVDLSFDANVQGGGISSMMVQPDGKIVIGGSFTSVQGTPRNRIARLNTDGTLDMGFDPNANASVRGTTFQLDGKILITGDFTTLQPNGAGASTVRNYIARLNNDGTLDTGFDPNANNIAACTALQPDGKIVICGTFTTLQPNGAGAATTRNRIARLNSDGTLDMSFDPNADANVLNVVMQVDGKMIITGAFSHLQPNGAPSSTIRNYVAQLNADGTITTFDPSANQQVFGCAIQGDGRVILCGQMSSIQPNGAAGATVRNRVARVYNNSTTNTLTAPDTSQVLWQRSGGTPEISQVTFEITTDSGANWSMLGNGTRVGNNWQLTGLTLPSLYQVRARGRTASGYQGSSSSLIESLLIQGPEMTMYSNNFQILSGDATPSINDNTDFGSVNTNGGTVTKGYGIYNLGNTPLALSGIPIVTISGTHAGDFTITQMPSSSIGAQGNTSLFIKFTPGAFGLRTATVNIANSDNDENPYTFAIQGTGYSHDLIGLTTSIGALAPTFDPAVTTYFATVSNATTSMTVTPTAVNPATTIYAHGGQVVSGGTSQPINLNVGANAITVTVTSPGQSNKVYTLNVTRAASSNADLVSLVTSLGSLTPSFSPAVTNYTMLVGLATTSVTVTPTRSDSTATIKVNNVTVASGNASGGIPLDPGDNVISVVVTAQDQSTKTYTITVTRAIGTDATLASLVPNVEALAPSFSGTTTAYSIAVSNHTSTITLTPKAVALDATITVNGSTVASGAASSPVSLVLGANVIPVVVTAGDGTTTKTYELTVQRTATVLPTGTLDTSLSAVISGSYVMAAASQPDGKTIIGGFLSTVGGLNRGHIARINVDGTVDAGFNPTGNNTIQSIAVLPSSQILIAGQFTTLQPNGAPSTTARNNIARLNEDGTLDPAFNPNPNGNIEVLVVQPDGKIIIGGSFTTLQPNGAPVETLRSRLARLNADGSLDTSFDPNPLSGTVYCVAVQPDGKILVGGSFTTFQPNGAPSATARNYIARLNADGSLDTAFNPNANSTVHSMLIQPDGKIVIGGNFSTLRPIGALAPTARNYIARLNGDGTLDTGFDPYANATVQGLALQADGKIVIAGQFTTLRANGSVGSVTRNRLARLNANGSVDSSFDPNVNGAAYAMSLQSDGKVLVGGQFSTFQPNGAASSIARNRFGRLFNDAATQNLSAPDATQLLWQRGGTAPEVSRVTFEQSLDGGSVWTPLGNGARVGTTANWQLTGLTLPATYLVRARGWVNAGYLSGSSSLVEAILSSAPEIGISGNNAEIPSGDITPALLDHTDFGFVNVTGGTLVRTFTINNTGAVQLNLSGTPKVAISGVHAADFTVTALPSSPVAASGNTTFQITFDPSGLGVRSASISIANSDANENPFTFGIQGTGFSPDLSNLVPSLGAMAPAFAPATTSYTMSVPLATTTIKVTPTKVDPAASIKVNNVTVASGVASGNINLAVGSNVINIVVTAADTSTKTYSLTVNRTANPTDANLASLVSSAGLFTPDFAAGTLSYTQIVPNAMSSLTVTPVTSDSTATVTVNGTAVVSGAASSAIPLPLPTNVITIVVTGGDGTTQKTYTLTVLKPSIALADNMFIVNSTPAGAIADIVINRSGGSIGAVSCMLSTNDGTATAPGMYTAQTLVPVNFADGETTQHVMIPIIANATTTTAKAFTVTLANPVGIELGAPTTAVVAILPPANASDTLKPSVTISSPVNNAKLSDASTVEVKGTASDKIGIRKVEVSTNNGTSYADAVLAAAGTPVTSYTFVMTPVSGTNTAWVRSTDFNGNVSPVAKVSFVQMRSLAVDITGNGTVTAGFSPTSQREVGKSLTIVAKPAPDSVFDGWTTSGVDGTGITTASAELPSLTFTMQTGLTLTAKFIANPFNADVVGTYSGLITPSGATPTSNETVGLLSNAKVQSNGTFTSTLKIDGLSKPVNGVFDNTGAARFGKTRVKTFSIARIGKPSLDITLQLDMSASTRKITGTLNQTNRGALTATSVVDADRAHYSAVSKVSSALAGTKTKPYTLVFPSKVAAAQPTGITSPYYPQGDGYATMTVNVNGTVTISGRLADHTPVLASAPLSKDNRWPIFAQLYAAKGSLAGMAALSDAAPSTEDVTGTNLRWVRPYQAVQWYPYGWTDGVLLDVLGARYVVPAAVPVASVFPGLQTTTDNATLQCFDGLLSGPMSYNITISPVNLVTPVPASTAPTMTIAKATGLLNGSFTHSDLTKTPFQGIILQKGVNRGGWGYFMTNKPKVLNYLGESGAVQIQAK